MASTPQPPYPTIPHSTTDTSQTHPDPPVRYLHAHPSPPKSKTKQQTHRIAATTNHDGFPQCDRPDQAHTDHTTPLSMGQCPTLTPRTPTSTKHAHNNEETQTRPNNTRRRRPVQLERSTKMSLVPRIQTLRHRTRLPRPSDQMPRRTTPQNRQRAPRTIPTSGHSHLRTLHEATHMYS